MYAEEVVAIVIHHLNGIFKNLVNTNIMIKARMLYINNSLKYLFLFINQILKIDSSIIWDRISWFHSYPFLKLEVKK